MLYTEYTRQRMKEYKVMEAKNAKEAEQIMNEQAKHHWRVVDVTFWNNVLTLLIITFERDKDLF